jgi:hypothetical protein
MRPVFALIALVGASTMGCATQFMGTAPGLTPGKTYVAGSDQNDAAIWVCATNGAECQPVDITEKE